MVVFDYLADVNQWVGWSTESCFRFDPRCGNEKKEGKNYVPKFRAVSVILP